MRNENCDYTETLSILEGELLAVIFGFGFGFALAWLGLAGSFFDLIIKVIAQIIKSSDHDILSLYTFSVLF